MSSTVDDLFGVLAQLLEIFAPIRRFFYAVESVGEYVPYHKVREMCLKVDRLFPISQSSKCADISVIDALVKDAIYSTIIITATQLMSFFMEHEVQLLIPDDIERAWEYYQIVFSDYVMWQNTGN